MEFKTYGESHTEWAFGIVVTVLIILAAAGLLLGGCAPQAALSPLFQEFNQDVQAGLADCREDPNACEPTLELLAAEMAQWAEAMKEEGEQ